MARRIKIEEVEWIPGWAVHWFEYGYEANLPEEDVDLIKAWMKENPQLRFMSCGMFEKFMSGKPGQKFTPELQSEFDDSLHRLGLLPDGTHVSWVDEDTETVTIVKYEKDEENKETSKEDSNG